MGRYVDEILQPGERVLYSTNEHWMFFLPAIAAWIVAVAFLVLWRLVTGDALMLFCLALAAVAGLVALYWTATAWFHRWTTETDVSNMRVVHKTGFIKRRTFEISLDKVESVDVNQSILGRLMNYGDVTIQGVGERTQTISTIASRVSQRHHDKASWHINHGTVRQAPPSSTEMLPHAEISTPYRWSSPPFATKMIQKLSVSLVVRTFVNVWLYWTACQWAMHIKKAPDNAGAKVLPAGEALISNGPLSARRNRRSDN